MPCVSALLERTWSIVGVAAGEDLIVSTQRAHRLVLGHPPLNNQQAWCWLLIICGSDLKSKQGLIILIAPASASHDLALYSRPILSIQRNIPSWDHFNPSVLLYKALECFDHRLT